MNRLINDWNAYWFPKTSTLNLSICRIITVAAQLFWFLPLLDDQINLLERNQDFIDPQFLILVISAVVPRHIFFTPDTFTLLYGLTIVAGITSLLGFFTRTSVLIFVIGNWIFISHTYSYADIHHPESIFFIFLTLLFLSPSGDSLSIDSLLRHRRNRFTNHQEEPPGIVETAIWPLRLVHILLAWTYFSTGLTKMIYGGLSWMNGYTFQSYVFTDAIRREIPLGIWVAQQHILCILLSVLTILFELFFFVSLVIPQTAPFFLISGLVFQLGLYFVAGHPFFQHTILLVLLLFFVDSEVWKAWLKKRPAFLRHRWRSEMQFRQSL